MGQEQEYERRRRAFMGYQVNAALLAAREAGRDRDARPSRAPWRGDHRRGARRSAERRVRSGREPPPHAEGDPVLAAAGRRDERARHPRRLLRGLDHRMGRLLQARSRLPAARSARPSGRRRAPTPTGAATDATSRGARASGRRRRSRTSARPTATSPTSSDAARRSFCRTASGWPTVRSCVRCAGPSGSGAPSDFTVFASRSSRRPVSRSRSRSRPVARGRSSSLFRSTRRRATSTRVARVVLTGCIARARLSPEREMSG